MTKKLFKTYLHSVVLFSSGSSVPPPFYYVNYIMNRGGLIESICEKDNLEQAIKVLRKEGTEKEIS